MAGARPDLRNPGMFRVDEGANRGTADFSAFMFSSSYFLLIGIIVFAEQKG
jgi:hypothetical protein